jgi:hypothetical protein
MRGVTSPLLLGIYSVKKKYSVKTKTLAVGTADPSRHFHYVVSYADEFVDLTHILESQCPSKF